MTTYSELLRDPRWQRKRLEILGRDEFTCKRCGDSESTLNVHHCYYERDKTPWEYPAKSLVTLCESCHEHETTHAKEVKKALVDALSMKGMLADQIHELACAVYESNLNGRDEPTVTALAWAISDEGARDCLGSMFTAATMPARKREAANG